MNSRLRALCDLNAAEARSGAGMHEYDGRVQDLSPSGVRVALARLGEGPAEDDAFDEIVLATGEAAARFLYGDLEEHRSNPLVHIDNLDLCDYVRDYAPAATFGDYDHPPVLTGPSEAWRVFVPRG